MAARLYRTRPGLDPGDAIDPDTDISGLPAVTGDEQSPMQAFRVRTAFNDVNCEEAPSLLAIQGPEHLKIDLEANGVHIRMGSLIMIQIIPPGDEIQITTIYGDVVLDPGTPNERTVPASTKVQHCINYDLYVEDACGGWSEPEPLTDRNSSSPRRCLTRIQTWASRPGPSPSMVRRSPLSIPKPIPISRLS